MLRLVVVAIALALVAPGAAHAKDAVVVKLREPGPAAKPAPTKPRASKRKVVKKRRAKTVAKVTPKKPAKAKRARLRPMP